MTQTDFQHLLIHEEDGILTITMNRPEVLSTFNETRYTHFSTRKARIYEL
jgi:enoyl-CoA hydratase/carnithine racemase